MRHINSAFEVAVATLTVFLLATALCYMWPDKDYGLSSWVQAVGSILAILAASHLATAQARRQFEDSRNLQHIDRAHSAYRTAKAVIAISDVTLEALTKVIQEFDHDRSSTMLITEIGANVQIKMLSDMRGDLDAMQLYEMPSSRLVVQVVAMRAIIRHATERISRVMSHAREMDELDFKEFFDLLDKAETDFAEHLATVKDITNGLRNQI